MIHPNRTYDKIWRRFHGSLPWMTPGFRSMERTPAIRAGESAWGLNWGSQQCHYPRSYTLQNCTIAALHHHCIILYDIRTICANPPNKAMVIRVVHTPHLHLILNIVLKLFTMFTMFMMFTKNSTTDYWYWYYCLFYNGSVLAWSWLLLLIQCFTNQAICKAAAKLCASGWSFSSVSSSSHSCRRKIVCTQG